MLNRYTADDPLRPPDWRNELAMHFCNLPASAVVDVHDDDLYELCQFQLRLKQNGRDKDQLKREEQAQWTAAEIFHDRQSDLRPILEARVLACQDIDAIAAKMGISDEAVVKYIVNYFDLPGRMRHTDFVYGQVLTIDSRASQAIKRAQLLKRLAYAAGPEALDLVLHRCAGRSSARSDPLQHVEAFIDSLVLERSLELAGPGADTRALQQLTQLQARHGRNESASITQQQHLELARVMLEGIDWKLANDPDMHDYEKKWRHTKVEPRAADWMALARGGKEAEEVAKKLLALEARTNERLGGSRGQHDPAENIEDD